MDIFNLMYDDFKFSRDKPIRLFEAFAGIGTQHMALKNLGLDIELVGISEIDKYAIQSYEAIHGNVKNYGGIGDFDRFPKDIDICTWSFPCQDISLAGKQKGMEDGTRSNYGYVFLDTVENTPKNERPKVLLMENVHALFSARFRDDWREIQLRLERLGYTNYADVLNAKDYGVAQNRERVFIVSILGEYNYNFPKPIPLTKRLKDYLEDEVEEKYYLSDKQIKRITESTFTQAAKRIHESDGIMSTLLARDYKDPKCVDLTVYSDKSIEKIKKNIVDVNGVANTITVNPKVNGKQPSVQDRIYDSRGISTAITTSYHPNVLIMPEKTKKGYTLAEEGDGVYIDRPHQKRGVVQKDKIQTIKTSPNDIGVVVKDTRNLKERLADDLIESGTVKGGEVINHSYTNAGKNPNSRLTLEDYIETKDGVMPTLTTRVDTLGVVVDNPLRIRKITPLEAWRLMGIKDEDFHKAKSSGMSDSQLYKQAGNAIVVDVLMAIFSQMIK